MILSLFRRKPVSDPVIGLQQRITRAALNPALYREGHVPDSFEGRFEALTLHVGLVVRRLQALPPPAREAAQELVDATFAALDRSIREMGVGDVGVPRKMKALGEAFYGRLAAYEAALAGDQPNALAAALARNVTEGADPAPLAAYVRASVQALEQLDLDGVFSADTLFPAFAAGG